MRLWSVCPSLLDRKGLGGCWVEALLCQAVLAGKTKCYKNHPQVTRWSECRAPLQAIGVYLAALQREATSRSYNYNTRLILHPPPSVLAAPAAAIDDDAQADTIAVAHSLPPLVPTPVLEVTQGQVEYEMQVRPDETARPASQ